MGLFGLFKKKAPAAAETAPDSPALENFYEDAATCLRYYPSGCFAFCRTSVGNIGAINETYGRGSGDKVLDAAAAALTDTSVSGEGFHTLIARDRSKFVTMMRYEDEDDLQNKLNLLHERFKHIGEVLPENPHIYMHTGYFPTEGKLLDMTVKEMVACAKIAESDASKRTHDSIVRYTDQLRLNAVEDEQMAADMEEALAKKQFAVCLQPRFDMQDGNVIAAKIVSRWIHPKKGIIGSYRYIPLFVKNGFIIKLDTYLFEQACMILRKWIDKGRTPVPLSLNAPRMIITDRRYMESYVELKKKYKIPDGLCELEFSERLVDEAVKTIGDVFAYFRDNGFLISIENFGMGNKSVSTISDFHPDSIKLSANFFEDGEPSEQQRDTMKLYIDTAKAAGIQTIATGVPGSCEQLMRDIGCEVLQGSAGADPMPVDDFEKAYLA